MSSKALLILFLLSSRVFGAIDCQAIKPIKIYKPKESKLFWIEYFNGYKILHRGSDQTLLKEKTIPLSCSTKLFTISVPVNRVILTSTTQVASLELLSLEDRLVGFQGKRYIYSERFKLDQIADVSMPLVLEELIKNKSDLVVAYDLNIASDKLLNDMRKLQIPIVLNSDYLENTPLARAEWLIYMASFFNKEVEAEKIYNEIAKNYNEITLKTKNILKRKKILVGDIQNGKWVTCGGKSDLSKLVSDAGGDLVFKSNKSTTERKSLEDLFMIKSPVDIWLTQNNWRDIKNAKEDSRYKKVDTSLVFNINQKINSFGANDYWEMGMARPDIMLLDLASVFYPDKFKNHQLVWYKKL